MKTIYKYELKLVQKQVISVPSNSKILTVQLQKDRIVLYAEVDTDNFLVPRVINIIGTGQTLPDLPLEYISTVQIGEFVWHIYETIER